MINYKVALITQNTDLVALLDPNKVISKLLSLSSLAVDCSPIFEFIPLRNVDV